VGEKRGKGKKGSWGEEKGENHKGHSLVKNGRLGMIKREAKRKGKRVAEQQRSNEILFHAQIYSRRRKKGEKGKKGKKRRKGK